MIRAEFNDDGIIYSRGEQVAEYDYADTVYIIEEVSENLVRILVNEGKAKGRILTVDKQLITVY